MKKQTDKKMWKVLAAFLALAMMLGACSSDDDGDLVTGDDDIDLSDEADDAVDDADDAMDDAMDDADDAMDDADDAMDDAMDDADDAMDDDESAMDDDAMGDMMGASGPGCSAVPADGEGSFAGMSDDPAGTAASANPVLSTLVTAVTEADLVDTLNSDGPFTIFAPTNDAFAAIPADQLDAVLADQELLTSILTLHVIGGESLSADELADGGPKTTVNGEELTFEMDAEGQLMVNGSATAICQNVPTANATVHIIDAVLMPAG